MIALPECQPRRPFSTAGKRRVANQPQAVAYAAMDNSAFYSVTLKNMAMPWTNRDFSVFDDLNDYVATYIGLVRDDDDFRKALYDDVVYVGDPVLGLPQYSSSNNAHYEALESRYGHTLDTVLVRRSQSELSVLPAEATAGLMTTRAAAKAFFIDGTNRANFRFTLLNHLCNDLEQVKDPSSAR